MRDVRHSHSTTVAVEVTDDARPQRPSPNDEPYDTCTETARDRESGTTTVPERDGEVRRRHVALCPEDRATMAHVYVGGTTMALCH